MDDVGMLASSLSDDSRYTLIMFYSRSCRLCKSVRGEAMKAVRSRREHATGSGRSSRFADIDIDVVEVDAEQRRWIPEVTHLGVSRVPCYVLMRKDGTAKCKTSFHSTKSKKTIMEALNLLLQEAM